MIKSYLLRLLLSSHPIIHPFNFGILNRIIACSQPYRHSNKKRTWNVDIDPVGTQLNRPLPRDNKLKVNLDKILIYTGIAQTYGIPNWDMRIFYAILKYTNDFKGTSPILSFNAKVRKKDPRLITIASEEIATGICYYILQEYFGMVHIADVYQSIQKGELKYANSKKRYRPDYFCQDSNKETLLAESKGGTGNPRSFENMLINKGKQQVLNVDPVNLPLRKHCNRVVIGTHFCIHNNSKGYETTTYIKDPEGNKSKEENSNSDVLLRLSYSKLLYFTGQYELANRLVSRDKTSDIFELFQTVHLPFAGSLEVIPIGITPFGDSICLYEETAKVLFRGKSQNLSDQVNKSLSNFSRERQNIDKENGYSFSNGIIIVHDDGELFAGSIIKRYF